MTISIKSRIKGALYGYAIGDAMGATTEFMSKEQIKAKYGQLEDIVGGGWLWLKPGEVTDDTQMTLCVCEAIESFPHDTDKMLDRCCENFAKWYNGHPKDVGACCTSVITRCKHTNDHDYWIEVADNPDSLGNGSLMRTMPIVLAGFDAKTALLQGRLTHNNDICDTYILTYYNFLKGILETGGLTVPYATFHLEPTGHVGHTFHNAVYWASLSTCFEEVIINAVNDGGDADTIAAIAGSLAGAIYEYESIPPKWIDKLDPEVRAQLDKYADIFEKLYKKVCTN